MHKIGQKAILFIKFWRLMNIEKVAKILNMLNKRSTDRIIDHITDRDPPLGREIRSALFRFEDLFRLDDRYLKIILQEVPKPLLPIALKGVDKQFVTRVVNNMSKRSAAILIEDLTMTGPKPRKEVEGAQQAMTALARLLLDQGKIFAPWLDKDNEIIY
jgi:flagellar motor switch protein FliG